MQNTYQPIDCNFYDRLEAWATQKIIVKIQFKESGNNIIKEIDAQIKDLWVENKVEFALLSNGLKLRLDDLIAVNGILLGDACEVKNIKFVAPTHF